jgi:hypothetical protein
MILETLARWFLHVERREPPRGVQAVDQLSDIGAIFDMDAARLAARYEADKRAMQRRQPPADAYGKSPVAE